MTTIAVPTAPITYNRDEEQVFRDLTRRGIERSLGKNELPIYAGVPIIMVSGTNATWNAPTGATPTKVPFNTIMVAKSSHTFNVTNNNFTIAFSGAYRIYFHLFHNGGGANKTVNIATCAFKNGTEVSRNTSQRKLDEIWNTEGAFVAMLVVNDVLDFRLLHTETVDVTFDLTYSRLMLEQLSPNPVYIDRTRFE